MNNYIVIALNENDGEFIKLISCRYSSIKNFIKQLSFNSEVKLLFFSIDRLSHNDWSYAQDAEEVLDVNNEKSLRAFEEEVDELLEKLDIKELEVVEEKE